MIKKDNILRRLKTTKRHLLCGDFKVLNSNELRDFLTSIEKILLKKEPSSYDTIDKDMLYNLLLIADMTYRDFNTNDIMLDSNYDKLEMIALDLDITVEIQSMENMSDIDGVEVISRGDSRDSNRMTETDHDFPELQGTVQKTKSIYLDDKYRSIQSFFESCKLLDNTKIKILVSLKYDGNSIIAKINKEGKVESAITRGKDGKGKDMLRYLKHLKFSSLTEELGVAYEAIITDKNKDILSERKGKKYKNKRSALAGILGDDEGYKNADLLDFIPLKSSIEDIDREVEVDFLKSYGTYDFVSFPLEGTKTELLEQIKAVIDNISKERNSLEFLIDGLVIEVLTEKRMNNIVNIAYELGRDEKRGINKWECCFKFESEECPSRCTKIEYTVGRTGKITPMLHFEEISFSNGNIYTKASLGSIGRLKELDIAEGDTVSVVYSNDVIPYIGEVIERNNGVKFELPKVCPSCGHTLSQDTIEPKCVNINCKAKSTLSIVKMVSNFGMKNISEGIINLLIDNNIITTFKDLLYIHEKRAELLAIHGIGEKKIDMMIREIESLKSRPIPAHILLASLNIESAGREIFARILKDVPLKDLIFDIDKLWLIFNDILDTYFAGDEGTLEILLRKFKENNSKEYKVISAIIELGIDDILSNVFMSASELMNILINEDVLNDMNLNNPDYIINRLMNIEGISFKRATSIVSTLTPSKIRDFNELSAELNIDTNYNTDEELDKIITLSGFRDKDDEIATRVNSLGIKVTDKFSAKTNLLIIKNDEDMSKSKAKKALAKNIPVITKIKFDSMTNKDIMEMIE